MNTWWRKNLWKVVLFPTLAALALVFVGLLRGYLHRQAGFDSDGRPLVGPVNGGGPSPAPAPAGRPFVSAADVYEAVAADLDRAEPADRPFLRYLTLAHRHNDPGCSAATLDGEREAVAEAVAAAAAGRGVALPAVDANRLVYRLDIRHLGWGPGVEWRKLMTQYRYGLTHEAAADARLRAADEKARRLAADRVVLVRADWFVVALVRPPLGGPGGDLTPALRAVPEKARAVARDYPGQPIDLGLAAAELGLADPAPLRERVEREAHLRDEFGLAPLLAGRTVPRDWWESEKHLVSPYQELARALGVGQPVRLR